MTYKFSKHKYDSIKMLSSNVYDDRIMDNWKYVLRELPNGVKDEISEDGFKQNVMKRILISSDIINMTTSYENLDFAVIRSFSDGANLSSLPLVGYTLSGYQRAITPLDNILNIGCFSRANTTGNSVIVGFAKETTIAQAKTALTGVEINYQLAEPIVTPLPDDLDPQTYELARQSELLDKAINAIIVLGGTIL